MVVQDQPAADAGRYDDAEDVLLAAAGTAPVFACRHANGVVVHPDRAAAGTEFLGQPGPQREPPPCRDIERRDLARWPLHRPAAAAPDARQFRRIGDVAGIEHLEQEILEVAPQTFGVNVAHRRNLIPGDEAPTWLRDAGRHLRAANVDRQDRSALCHYAPSVPPPKMRTTLRAT